tara:strand:- start:1212 stop:1625 length:414 start_codon:yes stop_codon:yes gene_type:complete
MVALMNKDTESLTNFGFVDLALVLIFSLLIIQAKTPETAINLKVGQFEPIAYWGKRHTTAFKVELTSDGFINFKGEKVRFNLSDMARIQKYIENRLAEYPTDRAWMFISDSVEMKYVMQISNLFNEFGIYRLAVTSL